MAKGLSNKQKVFVENYLSCWNATESARRAGYAYPNVEGPKNLVNPSIKAKIDTRLAEFKMSADEVLKRLSDMARSDIADFADVRTIGDLKKEEYQGKTHVVKKFKAKVSKDTFGRQVEEVELELYPADNALEKLGRHHKLFADRVEHTGPNGGPLQVEYVNDWRNFEPAQDQPAED